MAKSSFLHAKITGISMVVPQKEISLLDELKYLDNNEKKAARMTRMVGIDRRRIADYAVVSSDMCQQAAENLIQGMGISPESIDALIFISQTPDYIVPATACILQDKLKLSKECAAFDVNQGCAAYTYGLWLAGSLVESRAASRVLLLIGECSGKLTNPDNRITAPIFGDSGSATLIEYSEQKTESWYLLGTDGSGYESLIWPFGQARIPAPWTSQEYESILEPILDKQGNPWTLIRPYMDGGVIFNFTLNVVPEQIKELLLFSGCGQDEIDMLVLHQANKQIVQAVAQKSGFPLAKAPHETFSKYGNLAGASIPGVICDVLAPQVVAGKMRLLLSGFGVGLAWASAVLELEQVWCSGIKEYIAPEGLPNPEELCEYWKNKFKGNAIQGDGE